MPYPNRATALKQPLNLSEKQIASLISRVRPRSSLTIRQYSHDPWKIIKQKPSSRQSFQRLRQENANKKNQKYKELMLESTTMDLYNSSAGPEPSKEKSYQRVIEQSCNYQYSSGRQYKPRSKEIELGRPRIGLLRIDQIPMNIHALSTSHKSKRDISKSSLQRSESEWIQQENNQQRPRLKVSEAVKSRKVKRALDPRERRRLGSKQNFSIVPWESEEIVENEFQF